MSRNLYLGADILRAAGAPDRAALAQAATELFDVVRRTNFPLRAKAIAREVDREDPDLIGLQEVALWRRTPDGVTNDAKDASRVIYDFLGILRSELRARGLRYRTAVAQQEADTHLEAFGAGIRDTQAGELLAGPLASRSRQAILVGDLNSDPRDAGDEGRAYDTIAGAGFVNAFQPPFPATSGQNELVDNPASELERYIDHILSRPRLTSVRTRVVGNRPRDRIQGLWPSDHAGTVATLRLRR